jgi:Ca-activated chloride channel family protein
MFPIGPRLLLSVLIAAQLTACSSGAPITNPAPAEPLAEKADAAVATPALALPSLAAAPAAELTRALPASKVARMAVMPSLMPAPMPVPDQPPNERYGQISDNPIHRVAEAPVSTFSVDVDTGSYSNVRRLLNGGALPPADAVRVEELINYFPYDYALPRDGRPFAVHTALAPAPWNAQRVLLRVAIKGQDVAKQNLPPANLVFLVDVSGSMHSADKLPLLQSSLKLLVDQMRPVDRISLVTYAGSTRLVLPPTSGADKATIKAAIDTLRAGGGTAGASGIQLAYSTAQQSFIQGGINRILLATDGDFNVGVTDTGQLKKMVEQKRRSGISLSTLGFGTGNYNEALMEQIADVGDGAYSYVDSLMEGHKVLVSEMSSTLATIAKDVKVQIEFNPALVQEYRQIGYENRQLRREDFLNDKVDAGDIGAGHTVTALYELTLTGARGAIDPLRYGSVGQAGHARSGELAHLRLRYKLPGRSASELMEAPIRREAMRPLDKADAEFRFATAVAGFGQVLRGGRYTGDWTYADARALAAGSVGDDRFGYRGEFQRLAGLAQALAK